MLHRTALALGSCLTILAAAAPAVAQQVSPPAPRLLTVTPMGGQAGTSVEVGITHQHVDAVKELLFSTPAITATPVTAADGKVVPDRFLVSIAADAPVGVHDARVLSRLGVSSPRAFVVSDLPEVTRTKANNSIETAWPLPPNSICNATTTERAVDYYSFSGTKGRRIIVDCAALGIDSKLNPVLIVADAKGYDLMVSRTGNAIEFTPPQDGTYLVKVHGLTFQGGSENFYRLTLREVSSPGPVSRPDTTKRVSSFSWPPTGLPASAGTAEVEPNDEAARPQKLALPCDVAGSFFPANDTDVYEFEAKKDEVWWVEVASERLGRDTDAFVLVQRVVKTGDTETVTDVAELDDMVSPMKPGTFIPASTYTGPPYDAGSPDVLAKITIKEDGLYRLQVRDLIGGAVGDPENVYRLVIRQAAPDFALVAWAAHIQLRQNDFGTISKPIALRAGGTMAFEVVAVRRDGFDGEIELYVEGLPPGVKASGLTIPAGKVQGMLFLTAAETATPAFAIAKIFGRAKVAGSDVVRPCRLASVVWPIDYAPNDFPRSRLVADVPVSVTDSEKAPASIAAAEDRIWEATAGETLKIPLRIIWRNEFNGASIKLKPFGTVFAALKDIDLPIKAATAEAVLDLAALKTPPGDYVLAFKGINVSKYRPSPAVVKAAEDEQKRAAEDVAAVTAVAKALADKAAAAPAAEKTDAQSAAKIAAEKQKSAEAALAEATKRLKAATDAAAPKDILDFLVSEPIRISVKAAPAASPPAKSDK